METWCEQANMGVCLWLKIITPFSFFPPYMMGNIGECKKQLNRRENWSNSKKLGSAHISPSLFFFNFHSKVLKVKSISSFVSLLFKFKFPLCFLLSHGGLISANNWVYYVKWDSACCLIHNKQYWLLLLLLLVYFYFLMIFLLSYNSCTEGYVTIFAYVLLIYLSWTYPLHCSPSSLIPPFPPHWYPSLEKTSCSFF
jgi:hypothetical protein